MKQKLDYKRGQIYFVHEDPDNPPIGTELWSDRYGLIVSNDAYNATSGNVSIVYLTTSVKKSISPTHIPVTSGKRKAIAMCEQIYSVDVSRLSDYMGSITSKEEKDIDAALTFHLQLTQTQHAAGLYKRWENYIKEYGLEAVDEHKLVKQQLKTEQKYQEIIEQLTKERDSYKTLYESKNKIIQDVCDIIK